MKQPEAPPSTGLVAGKYQLITMIGRGGMGSVWEARHASLGTRFAIKFIETEYANSQEARSRFDKEARAAATIQSKHAIQIYDHGVTDDGKPYIVMELLEGEPLDKRIERMGRISLQDTARIIHQVCRGLGRAHERGIVHRDLKPENIFLVRTPDDDEEVAKVLDFGIAKVQNSPHSPGVTSSTKTGAVLGTPFYMSPEQARGLRNVDHRTDIWSLGVIAFKCVTGKLPFDGESVGDLLVKICTSPVPVPSQLVPGLPPSFDGWFARALDRDPERRFGTAHELSDALAFAAGVVRPGGTSPMSSLPSGIASSGMPTGPVGSAQPMNTPQATAAIATPGPGQVPSYDQQRGYGSGPSPQHPGGMGGTPHPGAMTAAGLTSSQMIPGVPSSKGKLIAMAVLAIAMAVGAAGFIVFKMVPSAASNATNGARLTSPTPSAPSGDVSGAVTPPPEPLAAKPGEPTADPKTGAAALAGTTPVATSAKSGTAAAKPTAAAPTTPTGTAKAKTGGNSTPPPLPSPTQPAVTPPTPPTPAPSPTPTPKKPNRNDPGY